MYTKESIILDKDIDNCDKSCSSCFLDSPNYCYQCPPGHLFDQDKCKPINAREISGYGRDCAICGLYNYKKSGQDHFDCAPCPYECAECFYDASLPDSAANPDKISCTVCEDNMGVPDEEGYSVTPYTGDDGSGYCKCIGVIYKGDCICVKESTYFDDDKICKDCDFDTHTKSGCPYECNAHQYHESDAVCKPCHYTCDDCMGPSEHECISCLRPYEGVESSNSPLTFNGNTWCLCPCSTKQEKDGVEYSNGCEAIKGLEQEVEDEECKI